MVIIPVKGPPCSPLFFLPYQSHALFLLYFRSQQAVLTSTSSPRHTTRQSCLLSTQHVLRYQDGCHAGARGRSLSFTDCAIHGNSLYLPLLLIVHLLVELSKFFTIAKIVLGLFIVLGLLIDPSLFFIGTEVVFELGQSYARTFVHRCTNHHYLHHVLRGSLQC